MGKFKTVVLKPKPCCYCGAPALVEIAGGKKQIRVRSWCRRCLDNIRDNGTPELAEDYPTMRQVRRLVGLPVDG